VEHYARPDCLSKAQSDGQGGNANAWRSENREAEDSHRIYRNRMARIRDGLQPIELYASYRRRQQMKMKDEMNNDPD
jgi:hypothetical protein